jgi:hypothetical protein
MAFVQSIGVSWLAPLSSKRKNKKKVGDVRGVRKESLAVKERERVGFFSLKKVIGKLQLALPNKKCKFEVSIVG